LKVLLDENLWVDLPAALNVFLSRHDLDFDHINNISPGVQDPDIPNLCYEHGFAALVTVNVKDFGARRFIFEALLEAGISVVVLRPSKRVVLTPEVQISMLLRHLKSLARFLKRDECLLLNLTESGINPTDLEQLNNQIR
jgi:hypothetical protein